MVHRGARNLVLLSRSGPENKHSLSIKEELKCARIETPACNIGDMERLSACLQTCLNTMPPLVWCIQAAAEVRVGSHTNWPSTCACVDLNFNRMACSPIYISKTGLQVYSRSLKDHETFTLSFLWAWTSLYFYPHSLELSVERRKRAMLLKIPTWMN